MTQDILLNGAGTSRYAARFRGTKRDVSSTAVIRAKPGCSAHTAHPGLPCNGPHERRLVVVTPLESLSHFGDKRLEIKVRLTS